MSGFASPDFPATASLGQSGVPASIEIVNNNDGANAGATNTITALTLVPACSATLAGGACSPAGAEPGVVEIAPTASGRAGSACAGRIFDVSLVNVVFGTVSFTPRGGPVTLPGTGSSCRIDLTFSVLRLPPADASPIPGTQVFELLSHSQSSAGLTAGGFGSDLTTIERATPAIATAASADVVLGSGTISDQATVSGRFGAVPGATVEFRLYDAGDAGCTGPAIFTATAPLSDAGVATSPPFTPTVAGTHRWIASYSGDANNIPVSGACNDPGESVVVAPRPPRIVSAGFESRPRVGATAVLRVRAVDASAPISGVRVRFGEAGGQAGTSACRVPAFGRSADPTQLRLPYAFRRAGRHRVTIDVLSGRCTGPVRLGRRTIMIDVAPRRTTTPGVRTSRCPYGWSIPTAAAASRARLATALLCLVNVQRRKYGRVSLLRSKRLALAAVGHSKDMVRRRYFAHDGPGRSFSARLRAVGYRGLTSGENIAYGSFDSAEDVLREWMASPGHRKNILYPRFRFAGVGLANGIPDTPRLPGTTSTMDYGASAS